MSSKRDLSAFNCSLARTLALVGNAWSLMILRDAFLGLSRFGDFQKSLGIARNILADRLDHLVRDGLLVREGTESRPVYRLTDKGLDLVPALAALMQWGDRWLSDGAPPMLLQGPEGEAIQQIHMTIEGGAIAPSVVQVNAGPGADIRTKTFLAGRAARPRSAGD